MLDVLVVGGGPTGRAVAAACGERGLRTTLLDAAPDRPWRATYGAWRDELPAWPSPSPIAATARGRAFALGPHRLDRDYVVLDVPALRRQLDDRLTAAGVTVQRGRAGSITTATTLPRAAVVIDAGGAGQPLAPHRAGRRRVPAEQTAVGTVLPAELATGLLDPGEALFMDWRPVPGAPPGWPSFLYAVPLGRDEVLLEETSLARRPGLDLGTLAGRLRARLAAHRIRPPRDARRELVRFPLDLPRHRAPGVLGFGAAAPFTHPATGYQLATALQLAAPVSDALASGLDSGLDRGLDSGSDSDPATGLHAGPEAALRAAQAVIWPPGAQLTRLLRLRGLESLLRLPPRQVPAFFEGFFRLPARHQRSYLSGRTDPIGTSAAMLALFRTTDRAVLYHLIGSSLLVRAPPESDERSSVQYRSA